MRPCSFLLPCKLIDFFFSLIKLGEFHGGRRIGQVLDFVEGSGATTPVLASALREDTIDECVPQFPCF